MHAAGSVLPMCATHADNIVCAMRLRWLQAQADVDGAQARSAAELMPLLFVCFGYCASQQCRMQCADPLWEDNEGT